MNETETTTAPAMKTTIEQIEATGDAEVAAGFVTRAEADASNLFEQRVLGVPSRECPNCGEEYARGQRRCGLCETRLL
ncbi:MAG: hypothetical protein WC655_05735 [Candidatus Hydrogenedentales bacterium]|jgi:hypothetical protein